MARPFFSVTEAFRQQHIALYDFVHGTTAAIWNTQWRVKGYLDAVPNETANDLEARFARGSGIHRVNVRRTFAEESYDEQREELARIADDATCPECAVAQLETVVGWPPGGTALRANNARGEEFAS